MNLLSKLIEDRKRSTAEKNEDADIITLVRLRRGALQYTASVVEQIDAVHGTVALKIIDSSFSRLNGKRMIIDIRGFQMGKFPLEYLGKLKVGDILKICTHKSRMRAMDLNDYDIVKEAMR